MKHFRRLVFPLFLVSLLVFSVGCEYLPNITISPPTTPTTTVPTEPIDPGWSIPYSGSQATFLPNIADVVAMVKPSVVAINTEVVTYDFFNQPVTEQGAGSGWIISENGIIVTNNHVVEGAKIIKVTLSDGRVFQAGQVRTDPADDLAIIQINASNLPAASVGNTSKLRVGDWVVAIGNPLGLGISAKEGIISRLGVTATVSSGQTLYDLVETSAAINPGNSGGPLVNMAGEVVGITSVKIAEVGVEGLGYAINIDSAAPIEDLVKTGRAAVRPWLGVVLQSVDESVAAQFDLSVNSGALITTVSYGSPAERAGLKQGDVIVGFEDKEITNNQDLVQYIRTCQVGQQVKITYVRGTGRFTTSAVLAENPSP